MLGTLLCCAGSIDTRLQIRRHSRHARRPVYLNQEKCSFQFGHACSLRVRSRSVSRTKLSGPPARAHSSSCDELSPRIRLLRHSGPTPQRMLREVRLAELKILEFYL